ncbi:MAG: insulinase family protein, partial [Phycisphaerae bacterium]|nr:insulinase family protein [Phycisphaerae bacterium]
MYDDLWKSGALMMEFRQRALANGLTIVGEVNTDAQTAAVGFFVRTGSRDETAQINGVSHFLEHMLFKGNEELSALEVNEAFDRTGAKFNAFTSEENTVYYAAVLPEFLLEVTELWAGLMRPSLRQSDFDMEKNVILEEIAMYKDTPHFDVMDKCRALHFGLHACGASVLGTNDSIARLMSSEMRAYFDLRYAPDNMVVACCGDFDFEAVCELVERRCGGWPAAGARRPLSYFGGTGQQQREEKANLVREHICMMSAGVGMQDERRFAMSLLAAIVGDDTGSRYFWELVDPAIAETAIMQADEMDGVGALYSYIRCSPQEADKVSEIVVRIFDELAADGVTQAELEAARNKVLSALTIKSEQPMGRLVNLGFDWVYRQDYRSVADEVASVRGVTVEDVNALVREFDPRKFTRYAIGPV